MTGSLQLFLPIDNPPDLILRLREAGLSPSIRVSLHQNRRVMVTSRPDGALRVHAGYAWAPDDVLEAIVRWSKPRLPRAERRGAARVLLAFPVHDYVAKRPVRRVIEPPEPGDDARIARLRDAHAECNRKLFEGRLASISIRLSGRMRRKLGHYEPASSGPQAIVISRRHLRRDGWQAVLGTLLHEMVHQWQEENGHPVDHGPRFRRKAREVGAEPRAVARRR